LKFPKINFEELINEVAALAGIGAVGYGLYQIYEPAAWIVCGTALFLYGARGILGGDNVTN